jgi:Cd2+/Zn2+-exporting ATPase/Cu+-exporting ATPase
MISDSRLTSPPDEQRTLEIPIKGMDCADCAAHVRRALAELPGVSSVEVYLAAEKAVLRADTHLVTLPAIQKAVAGAGYSMPEGAALDMDAFASPTPSTDAVVEQPTGLLPGLQADFSSTVIRLFGIVFGVVIFVIVFGEWLGVFDQLTAGVPWYIWLAGVAVGGYPVFRNVIRAAVKRQVISHTLMTLGVVAALAVGEWATALVVVFFMRIGDYAEHFTTERARRAVRDLTALAPQKAWLEQEGREISVPVARVKPGDIVVIRPGEQIPVDGLVLSGQATIDQAAITGESMPVEAAVGGQVYAATFTRLGSLRVRATAVGRDTTFGKVIRLVEEAEAHRAEVQRIADRFSAYYLPIVAGIALLTLLLRRDPLATAAVLVVACSCSFALATPIAMLASIGAGAKRGLLIKGGKYIETLARVDTVLVDKTGTLTLGKPEIQTIIPFHSWESDSLLSLAASAERFSEHPLALAVRTAAAQRGISLLEVESFQASPGLGVTAIVEGKQVMAGSASFLPKDIKLPALDEQITLGKSLLWIMVDGELAGVLAAADTLRPEAPAAIEALRGMGIAHIELLTGDRPASAAAIAEKLGVSFRAGLLPEEKIAVVREYQQRRHVVVMVGDGINDAPALAQADVGIAMTSAHGSISVETAHVVLLREDWSLVPEVLRIARTTMRVVKGNIAFTAIYNLLGLSLAAFGILPPILAAAAQSLPDIGILANSSRLLKQKGTHSPFSRAAER